MTCTCDSNGVKDPPGPTCIVSTPNASLRLTRARETVVKHIPNTPVVINAGYPNTAITTRK
ncbi:hypothetical protein CY34DRAFT_797564 [Suillus luteus UH-Slu-Lm8-n1]|uniref:Uncharacterized protein n=1 Tax=Suillus luteus UH-Slu-Lm8-n1 TaxID=930992 RepID=A0A0D0B525_9AGAM|nr:hypothetical protein CY34DRAFT_797564 [Suillus luteus UH-Slu-Lm8-n1]